MLSPVEAWWAGLSARSFDKLRMTGQPFYLQKINGMEITPTTSKLETNPALKEPTIYAKIELISS
jgi:hypothetical protein